MEITRSAQARAFGAQLAFKVNSRPASDAYDFLAPILAEKTPFRLLDLIGGGLAECPDPQLGSFLEEIAAHAALGGWTVIASALRSRFPLGMEKILQLARHFIVQADAWFACDCFGERVLGQALVNEFDTVLQILSSWRFDQNRWIRRSVGVAGHFWAKRARGALQQSARAVELMAFFKPLLNEPQIDAAKGTGWALKTLGRSYPQALFNFLNDSKSGNFSPVILRKALKFLPKEMRTAISH